MVRRDLFIGAVAFGLSTSVFVSTALAADDARAVVEAYLTAWNAHDSAEAASHFASDVSYFDASVGTPTIGADAAKTDVIENFLNAVPDAVWNMKGDPLMAGDKVSFEWEFSGTNTGVWADGTAATGKAFTLNGVSMFEVNDAKIIYQADYYDALGFYKQLGLM